ncbi:UNVERIFIED_CONTAM: Heavy metal-associated isoprenylated plant protein 39 [Sesamum calycinum]|uniref:Heavy metal-associated isoprenylated plant protein 39 n=1 Tax=Sesamum calycinum TaxID=2727403 RepID=A0AAW2J7Q5_9LAMI
MTKKLVLNLEVRDQKQKEKAMKAIAGLSGIESLAIDMKEKKLTVVGEMDPVQVVVKLRKRWHTDILTVGPAKEPEKKQPEPPKKDDNANKTKEDKKTKESEQIELHNLCKKHNPYYYTHYFHVSVEENPNSCVIF